MDTLGLGQVPGRGTGVVLSDSYIIGRRLGRGAMGEVYEAQHVRLPGHFAVKLLLPELQGNQEAFARFCREAEIMSQLRHPNIVQIFDFNVAPDARPYFVMEYLEGRDLQARLRDGPLTLPAVTRIVDAVASALALAHAHGVVHRDLKPANIFLATVDGQTDELVKVLDFGISKVRSAAAQISHAVDLLGTPSYMAPEQARGQTDAIDGRTDQFALAAIAYRMLTGQEPFQGDDTAAVLYQVVHEEPQPLSLFLPPGWDTSALQAVLDRALAKQPERRFGGMMELARAFEDAAERTLGTATGRGLADSARASRAYALRLDDAAIDTPPPVRTPTPLVLKPIRRLPTPTPVPAPARTPAPIRQTPLQMDWELRNDIDVVPKNHTRAAVLGLLALGAVAILIVTGWYKKLPAAAGTLRRQIHEWTGPSETAPQTNVAPAPPAEPPPTAPEPAPSGANPREEEPPRPAAPAPSAAPPAREAPSSSAAPPEKPRAPRRHHASRNQRARDANRSVAAPTTSPAPPATVFGAQPPPAAPGPGPAATGYGAPSPPPPPTRSFAQPPPPREAPARTGTPAPVQITPPANPPLDGRAFEIAPPKTTDTGRDLAPPADDTLPMSP